MFGSNEMFFAPQLVLSTEALHPPSCSGFKPASCWGKAARRPSEREPALVDTQRSVESLELRSKIGADRSSRTQGDRIIGASSRTSQLAPAMKVESSGCQPANGSTKSVTTPGKAVGQTKSALSQASVLAPQSRSFSLGLIFHSHEWLLVVNGGEW